MAYYIEEINPSFAKLTINCNGSLAKLVSTSFGDKLPSGGQFQYKDHLSMYGYFHYKDKTICIMWISTLVRWDFYIETAPRNQ